MAALLRRLPAAKNLEVADDSMGSFKTNTTALAVAQPLQSSRGPPPYGKRRGFVPRSLADFGDGGAFPEIHVAQYPLDMGRKDGGSSKTIALQMDSEGNIKYDAILHQGRNHKTLIQGSARD